MLKKFLSIFLNWRLEAAVLIVGAVIMVFEITASRLLAPYLGASLITWTALIGVVLASLSAGYYCGGRLADHRADRRYLALLIAAAGFLLLISLSVQAIVLTALAAGDWSLKVKASVAALVLLSPTSLVLGTVSPYAAKLKLATLTTAGGTIGKLYALSTLGSLLGTFGAGFWLVPAWGTIKILVFLIIVLWLLAAWLFFDRLPTSRHWMLFSVAGLLLILAYGVFAKPPDGLIDQDTVYSRVWIYDAIYKKDNQPIRLMRLDAGFSSAMYLQSHDLVFDYTKFYHLAGYFNPSLNKALMIGGAAYSYPKDFLRRFPRAELTVVEIDAAVTELARRYFSLTDDPRLIIQHQDGRLFLNKNREKYDAILVDAFSASYSVPFPLTTKEAVQRQYNGLNQDGLVMVNIVGVIDGAGGKFTRSLYHTYKKIFPQVYLLPVDKPDDGYYLQNIILVALKSKTKPSFETNSVLRQNQLNHLWTAKIDDAPILTDDWAPTDYFASLNL